jgi:hypothetical protein
VLRGSELVDLHRVGWADREQGVALNPQHRFRISSNTKLSTSCAVLRMMEEGRLGLDDPIEGYLTQRLALMMKNQLADGLCLKSSLGRYRRNALVDSPAASNRGCCHDTAPLGVLAPFCVRLEANGLSNGVG